MNKSDSITKLASALNKAQKKIGTATKDAANPYFKSKYANLEAVMEACKEALNENGIAVLQPVLSTPDGDMVETVLLHESGEFVSSTMKLIITKQDMQAYGSAVSYARRYSLQSMCFIGAEDDDGESTMNRQNPAFNQTSKQENHKPEPKKETKEEKIAKADATIAQVAETNNKSNNQETTKPAVAAKFEAGW